MTRAWRSRSKVILRSDNHRLGHMTPPIWLDTAGRRRTPLACWTCGREVAPMRFRADDLRRHGWAPPQTLQIPDWCGCWTEYLPVPAGDGWWCLVPIWEPDVTPNPLRRWEPAGAFWAADP
jgi:hypothetical protein